MTILCKTPAKKGHALKKRIDMTSIGTLILAGGEGKRLDPLTINCCKPAIPFAGKYRLIDVALGNAINSGCQKISVLTQFLSTSLHRHLTKNYQSIDFLSVEKKPNQASWYEGTADAIRKNIEYLQEMDGEYILILSGDQIYQLDLEQMVVFAEENGSDLVIASTLVDQNLARRMGILQIGHSQNIIGFTEKPEKENLPKEWETSEDQYLGSMGIYLFKRHVLIDLLLNHSGNDFGKDLIPFQIKKGNSSAYIFDGFWEDVGTIKSYYASNMNLLSDEPFFDLFSMRFPVKQMPGISPSKIKEAEIKSSFLCEGSFIESAVIRKSIIGPQTFIGEGTTIDSSYILGNLDSLAKESGCIIGKDCHIRQSIIEKNVKIGSGVRLINQHRLEFLDHGIVCIRDGILIVKQGSNIPDHFSL